MCKPKMLLIACFMYLFTVILDLIVLFSGHLSFFWIVRLSCLFVAKRALVCTRAVILVVHLMKLLSSGEMTRQLKQNPEAGDLTSAQIYFLPLLRRLH